MSTSQILELLPKLGRNERREILDRLCALEEADCSESHQQLVNEALHSGPTRSATPPDWEGALQRGLERGQKE
jgi:hypothetical protein